MKNKKQIVATFENAIAYNDKLWFSDMQTNELYCYDIKEKKATMFCKFEEESEDGDRLFGQIIRVDDILYLIPFFAKNMYRVNLKSASTEKINLYELLKDKKDVNEEALMFLSAHFYRDKIYMISVKTPIIIEYNCKSNSVSSYSIGSEKIRKTSSDTAFTRKTMLWNDKILIPLCGENMVVSFDLLEKRAEAIMVGDKGCRYSAIGFDGESFWLAPRAQGPFVCWNIKNNSYVHLNDFPEDYIPEGIADVVVIGGKIYFVPMGANMLLVVDSTNKKISKCLGLGKVSNMSQCSEGNILYLFSAQTGELFIIDNMKEHVDCRSIVLEEKNPDFYRKKISRAYAILSGQEEYMNIPIVEDYETALEDLQKYLKERSYEEINKQFQSIGKDIYNAIQ